MLPSRGEWHAGALQHKKRLPFSSVSFSIFHLLLLHFHFFRQLGWYADDRKIIYTLHPWQGTSIDWSGSLVGVAEYGLSTSPVLIKLSQTTDINYYINYNSARGINSWTQEGRNQVLITEQLGSGGPSNLIAKLESGSSHNITNYDETGQTLTVHVSNISFGTPSLAKLSISLSCANSSDCSDGDACNGDEACVNNVCKSGLDKGTCPLGPFSTGFETTAGYYYGIRRYAFDLTAGANAIHVSFIRCTAINPGTLQVYVRSGPAALGTVSSEGWTKVDEGGPSGSVQWTPCNLT